MVIPVCSVEDTTSGENRLNLSEDMEEKTSADKDLQKNKNSDGKRFFPSF